MRDYICLNNQKVMLTKDQVAEIRKIFNANIPLGDVTVGGVCSIGPFQIVVLEHFKETTAIILNGLLGKDVQFGKTNDYRKSNVRDICDKFAYDLCGFIGSTEQLIYRTLDLTANDGLCDYGKIDCHVSLLSADLYRRYGGILDKNKAGEWWLATAFSAPTHGNSNWVNVVTSSGCIANFSCCKEYGVRPFCILRSDTVVSM